MAIAAVVLLSLAVLGTLGVITWTNRQAAAPRAQSTAPPPDGNDAVLAANTETAARPVYRYSVIPGGAHNRAELADALDRDRVVAEHYQSILRDRVREERLAGVRQAYVSYRIGDRVYWTKHKVTLPAGEPILTDGVTTIRARCGNCIADEPQLPTSNAEPALSELDAIAPGIPPLLPSLARCCGVPGTPTQPAPVPSDSSSIAPLLPLIPFGLTASSAQRRSTGETAATPSASELTASTPEPGYHEPDNLPGGFMPGGLGSGGFGSGGFGRDGLTPNQLDPIALIPGTLIPQILPDGPPSFAGDDWTANSGEQPAPIPEPSTFVLLGSGIAGAVWRSVRSRYRR